MKNTFIPVCFRLLIVCCIANISQISARPELINYSATLPATDGLGRKLPTHAEVGDVRPDKYVGLFYWTWHMNFHNNPPHNIREVLTQNPEAADNYYHYAWPKPSPLNNSYFFWDEPLFGYYRNSDRWVLRKHAEMLADAGVDVVFFDCTNGHLTWKESYMALCEAWTEARTAGIKTPQVAFLLAFGGTDGSRMAMVELYKDLYKPGLYRDLWFQWQGKPLIMAYPDTLVDVPGDEAASAVHREIREFFTFRPGQPLYDTGPQRADHWGWLQVFPQHGFFQKSDGGFEQVPVGVGQNWSEERGLTAMNAPLTFGRSYTHVRGHAGDPYAVNLGLNFQEQWDRALNINPDFIFITGWNEWVANRFKEWNGQENAFPDQFSQEHSRDIEPMKGGHGDNYYYQMISNIRRFKGMPPAASASEPVTIAIDGIFEEWDAVEPEFKAHIGSTLHRDSPGWQGKYYSNDTGRNDFTRAKVARDAKNLYFLIETSGPITCVSDPAWMRLFIDVDRNKKTGWEGYDYVVNRQSPDKDAILEKSKEGWSWEKVTGVAFSVKDNKMELEIPQSALGIGTAINFEFKWSDNMQNENTIMDFFLNGDVAPAGRFNYRYSAN